RNDLLFDCVFHFYHIMLPACISSPLAAVQVLHSFPTRRSSDLHHGLGLAAQQVADIGAEVLDYHLHLLADVVRVQAHPARQLHRSEEHTSELQSREKLVCRLLLEKKKIELSKSLKQSV